MNTLFSDIPDSMNSNYTEMVFWVAVLLFVLICGGWIIGRIRVWAKSPKDDPRQTPQSMLTVLREAYERGDIEEEEYLLVKERLTQAVRDMYLKDDRKPSS